MNGIGALVITRNEERTIQACLESLDFCDERVVVDSFSHDATIELASPLADRIYQRSFRSYGEQKNWGMDQLSTPWVLILDADERIPAELAQEMIDRTRSGAADGFWIYRRNFFFGRPVLGGGWGRDRVLRLFRRGAGRYDLRMVHEEVHMDVGATTASLSARLDHHSYLEWPSTFDRLLSYSTRSASDRIAEGRRATTLRLLFAPGIRFFKQYLVQGGLRDGIRGFVTCGLGGVTVFLRLAKMRLGEIEPAVVGAAPGGELRLRTVKGPPPSSEGFQSGEGVS